MGHADLDALGGVDEICARTPLRSARHRRPRRVASGLVWPETQDLLVQKAFLMHQPFGQGHVIAFAEEPNYRGFSEASMLLFMNAVRLGPGTSAGRSRTLPSVEAPKALKAPKEACTALAI